MKKSFILIILLGMACGGFSQPQINTPSFPSSVNLFDKFEVSFTLGNSYSNPYDPNVISIYAMLYSPDGHVFRADAFYFEDYTFGWESKHEIVTDSLEDYGWRIRFTPNQVGTWRFTITGTDANGTSSIPSNVLKTYVFTCNAVTNADGFISKANSKFLKREVVKNGQRQFRSFFPIGPNVAYYDCDSNIYSQPNGKYFYKKYIDSLSGNANFMRVFLNRYQYLSLYGPEYTHFDVQGNPVVYFDSTINQKDSAELDYIITYAAQHGISVMPCIFSYGDFSENPDVNHKDNDSSIWSNNPFHTQLGLSGPCDFFNESQVEARRITKNLIRYIVSRWGYATNIMCWELWNEVKNMFPMCDDDSGHLQDSVLLWHNEMAAYIRSCDPYQHCVSTSMGKLKATYAWSHANLNYPLYLSIYNNLDIVQQHVYTHLRNAESRKQISNVLLDTIKQAHNIFQKPFFMGEFGFGNGVEAYIEKDSCGIGLHNSLWSSLFSTAIGPGAFWWWGYLDRCHLFHNRYSPLLTFCENLPILSETFTAHRTGDTIKHKLVFPNSLETYYMINATEDTIYGWSQDTAFAYQSLRWLTDYAHRHNNSSNDPNPYNYTIYFDDNAVFDPSGYLYTLNQVKRPGPSSNSNIITIPISNKPVGTSYKLTWYNTETGLPYNYSSLVTIQLNEHGEKVLRMSFPSNIRNIKSNTITNNFGDVVFSLTESHNDPLSKEKRQTLE